jgi:fatty acid desaturase
MANTVKHLFTNQEIARFYKKRNGINILTLTILYSIAAIIIGLYPRFGNWLYIIVGYLVMGAVQHWIATFVHEAAHLNLFTNRKMNDFFGHFLCAAPLISYLKDYRYFHMEHHRHAGDFEKDPELKFYRSMDVKPSYSSAGEVAKVFLNDFTGVTYLRGLGYVLKFFGEKRNAGIIEKPTHIENLCVLFWFVGAPILMWKIGLLVPFLIFWALPVVTLTPVLIRWHSFGEHIREQDVCPTENTLTHRFSLIPELFLYPINSSFHLEHHLYPQMPWHELKNFYNWANQNPVYREKSSKLTVDGYFLGDKTVLNVAFPITK